MQLDALSAVLRPRQHWEAIDLGFTMVQRWLWPVYRAWFALLLPLFLVLNLACWQQPWLAALLLWWLKPLLDRIPLYVLSHALFGNVPTLRATLRALPRLLWRQWLPALTWLRLDPARSFHLPVLQLEGLRGRERRARPGHGKPRTAHPLSRRRYAGQRGHSRQGDVGEYPALAVVQRQGHRCGDRGGSPQGLYRRACAHRL